MTEHCLDRGLQRGCCESRQPGQPECFLLPRRRRLRRCSRCRSAGLQSRTDRARSQCPHTTRQPIPWHVFKASHTLICHLLSENWSIYIATETTSASVSITSNYTTQITMLILLVVGHIRNDADYVNYYVWELFDRRRTSAGDNTAIVALPSE